MSKKLIFTGSTSYRKIIYIKNKKYVAFDLNGIPKNFGCQVTEDGKEGISNYINFKGLTYYLDPK